MLKHNMNTNHEILQILQEECAEVIQAASKCVRFGEKDNILNLQKELGDVLCMLEIMHEYDMIAYTTLEKYTLEKREKLKKYTKFYKD